MTALVAEHLPLLASAPEGIKKLRGLILELAVRGKLVPQDPNDEPASELLKRIAEEKAQLVAEGKIRGSKPQPSVGEDDISFVLPNGWAVERLGVTSHLITKGVTPTTLGHAYTSSGINFVKVENIESRRILKSAISQFISPETDELMSRSRLEAGDVLFSIAGTIGKTCLIQKEDLPANTNQALAIIRGTSTVFLQDFLLSQLDSFVSEKTKQRARGGAMPNVSLGDLSELVLVIPPITEQRRIVAKVDELMALCDQLEAQQDDASAAHAQLVQTLLDSLIQAKDADDFAANWQRLSAHFDVLFTTEASIDALKQTILQLAVMGKLVPQDPNDEPASGLLKRISGVKERLVAEGRISKQKTLPAVSEEERSCDLPKTWAWCRLQDAFDVRDGTHDTPKYQRSGFPLVTSKNLYTGRLDFSDVKLISEEDHRKISVRSKVDRGDVLFAMIGSIGNPVIVDTDISFSIKNVALVKQYSPGLMSERYLLQYLLVAAADMREKASGAVQSFVSLGSIRLCPFAVPPLSEQHRIVAKVDELMAFCDQIKTQLSTAHQLHEKLAGALVEQAVA
jgi:type I restriction enzyme S subunit